MTKIFSIIIIISIFLNKYEGFTQEVSSNDYLVYSSVIDQFLNSQKVKKKNIVIISDSDYRVYKSKMSMFNQTVADLSNQLDSVNTTSVQFENSFQLRRKKVILKSESEIDLLFENGAKKGWKKFYEKYPRCGGILRISKILYASDNSKCLMYLSLMRHGLGGGGYYILFNLKKNNIESTETVWQA